MTAARRLKGVTALRDAADAVEPAGTVQVIYLDGKPHCGFKVKTVAEMWDLPYRRLLAEIQAGRVGVITGSRDLVVPVSQLAVIADWMEHLDPAG